MSDHLTASIVPATEAFAPDPILGALADFSGTIVDLEEALSVDGAELRRAVALLAAAMRREGLKPGDRVVTAVSNGPRFFAALGAILSCGGSPLLVHAGTPARALRRQGLATSAAFVTGDWLTPDQWRGGGFEPVTLCGDTWAALAWDTLASDAFFHPPQLRLRSVPLHPTSGTTGMVKIAVRPAACALAEAAHYVDTLGIDAEDWLLAAPPMSHAYAYGMCVMVPLLSGASVLSMRGMSVTRLLAALETHAVSIFVAVPGILQMMLFGATGAMTGPRRFALSAGSPLPSAVAEEFQNRCGARARPLYGATETGGIAVAPEDGPPLSGTQVGATLKGVSVEIRDQDELGLDDGAGRCYVRSSSMMAGYLNGQTLDTSPLCDGWFHTGDIGRIDGAGLLQLVARETDVINLSGMKVVPSEVEEVIGLLGGVQEARVYAGQRPGGLSFVKAAVVAPRLDAAAIRRHCEEHLVYYKRPERIYLLDALPKTPAGKVLQDQLP